MIDPKTLKGNGIRIKIHVSVNKARRTVAEYTYRKI